MSGHRDIEEAGNTTKAADNSALFNSIDNARNSMSPKDYSSILQSPGKDNLASLPSLELMDAKSDVPPPPELKGSGTSDKDLAQDGIKRHHGKDSATTEFPNGVKISTAGAGADVTLDNGQKMHISGAMHIDAPKGAHQSHPGSNLIVDSHNKPLYQENKDGSKTVFTETGAYTVRNDGSVTKESALKNRDGSFTIVDTNSPLGGLSPKDMDSVNQPGKQHSH